MKRLFLLHGDPKSGKSYLAEALKDGYSFEILSLDELYVKFIKTECEEFYFKHLRQYIAQHYHYILDAKGYTKNKFGRDHIKEWHEYILNTISDLSATHDNIVVEGYLLIDCLNELERRMSGHLQVFIIRAEDKAYLLDGKSFTVEEIALLR